MEETPVVAKKFLDYVLEFVRAIIDTYSKINDGRLFVGKLLIEAGELVRQNDAVGIDAGSMIYVTVHGPNIYIEPANIQKNADGTVPEKKDPIVIDIATGTIVEKKVEPEMPGIDMSPREEDLK